jgi:hypothetical protein
LKVFLPPAYAKQLSQLITWLHEKYRILRADRRDRVAYAAKWPVQGFEEQMNLF